MPVHSNSIAAFHGLNIAERNLIVLSVYADSSEPLTDRAVMERLSEGDPNKVRPRATELIEAGYLYEVDSVICEVTGKRVRRCTYSGLVSPAP